MFRTIRYPVLGQHMVAEIGAEDLLRVLSPIWHERPSAARRAKQRLGLVMVWTVANGHRADDPSAALSAALGKADQAGTHRATVLAFEFMLSAFRPSEAKCVR